MGSARAVHHGGVGEIATVTGLQQALVAQLTQYLRPVDGVAYDGVPTERLEKASTVWEIPGLAVSVGVMRRR